MKLQSYFMIPLSNLKIFKNFVTARQVNVQATYWQLVSFDKTAMQFISFNFRV